MSFSTGREGSDSRCCRPADPAWDWVDYTDPDHEGLHEIEEWLNTLAPFARQIELGRVEDLMEAAAQGRLFDSNDELTPIKPIRRDPEIFEIRHKALTKALRFYHGEPPELPVALVAVHRHIKTSNEQQEGHVKHAAKRYADGRSGLWQEQ